MLAVEKEMCSEVREHLAQGDKHPAVDELRVDGERE